MLATLPLLVRSAGDHDGASGALPPGVVGTGELGAIEARLGTMCKTWLKDYSTQPGMTDPGLKIACSKWTHLYRVAMVTPETSEANTIEAAKQEALEKRAEKATNLANEDKLALDATKKKLEKAEAKVVIAEKELAAGKKAFQKLQQDDKKIKQAVMDKEEANELLIKDDTEGAATDAVEQGKSKEKRKEDALVAQAAAASVTRAKESSDEKMFKIRQAESKLKLATGDKGKQAAQKEVDKAKSEEHMSKTKIRVKQISSRKANRAADKSKANEMKAAEQVAAEKADISKESLELQGLKSGMLEGQSAILAAKAKQATAEAQLMQLKAKVTELKVAVMDAREESVSAENAQAEKVKDAAEETKKTKQAALIKKLAEKDGISEQDATEKLKELLKSNELPTGGCVNGKSTEVTLNVYWARKILRGHDVPC